ncbi:MAG: hypothetical protein ABR915_06455, partial [Thermoguttaceae bacterium]
AGRRNRLKWKGLTDARRERLRQAALRIKPWTRSTGPKTPEGKRRVALNGAKRQRGDVFIRALQRELEAIQQVIAAVTACRNAVLRSTGPSC